MAFCLCGLRDDAPTRRTAWRGATPVWPFVDACMRSLIAHRIAQFPDAGDADVGRRLSPVLDWRETGLHLARNVHRLRTGHPLVPGADAIGHHGNEHAADLQPDQAGATNQDPTGAFTPSLVPGTGRVPDPCCRSPGAGRGASRLPLSACRSWDVAEAGAPGARAESGAVGPATDVRDEATQVSSKHPVRKRRSPRRGDGRQLSLDL